MKFSGHDVYMGGMKRNEYFQFYMDNKRIDNENVVKILNEQHEEIELHKERIVILSELLDLADAIIDLSDDEKAKQGWEKKNRQATQKWEQIIA